MAASLTRQPETVLSPTYTAVQAMGRHSISTNGRGFTDISGDVAGWLGHIGAASGIVSLYLRHTSASLTIQENADPEVQDDLMTALDGLAPEGAGYTHAYEGPDDMPAHIKAMLTATSLTIPVMDGRMDLGRWQGIYLIEHRAAPHDRQMTLHFTGTVSAGNVGKGDPA
ncbi:MAG: secondary thiamine-phosphate synthase enzyme YjbQ [Pseudomonadota bacterium]